MPSSPSTTPGCAGPGHLGAGVRTPRTPGAPPCRASASWSTGAHPSPSARRRDHPPVAPAGQSRSPASESEPTGRDGAIVPLSTEKLLSPPLRGRLGAAHSPVDRRCASEPSAVRDLRERKRSVQECQSGARPTRESLDLTARNWPLVLPRKDSLTVERKPPVTNHRVRRPQLGARPDRSTDTAAALAAVREVIDAGPFTDTWDSLAAYEVPDWFPRRQVRDLHALGRLLRAPFGNEWYRGGCTSRAAGARHHRDVHGDHAEVGYKTSCPASQWRLRPAATAQLFRRAGARSSWSGRRAHDGVAMYDEPAHPWNVTRSGRSATCWGRAGGVRGAVDRARGSQPPQPSTGSSSTPAGPSPPTCATTRSSPTCTARRCRRRPDRRGLPRGLAAAHGPDRRPLPPQVLWFDWWIEHPAFEPYRRMLAALLLQPRRQWGRGVVIQ